MLFCSRSFATLKFLNLFSDVDIVNAFILLYQDIIFIGLILAASISRFIPPLALCFSLYLDYLLHDKPGTFQPVYPIKFLSC